MAVAFEVDAGALKTSASNFLESVSGTSVWGFWMPQATTVLWEHNGTHITVFAHNTESA